VTKYIFPQWVHEFYPSPSVEHFTFVGFAYVHGIMDWEVLVDARERHDPRYDRNDTA
jgi:hypothetical protein